MRLGGHNFREKISDNQRNKTHQIKLQKKRGEVESSSLCTRVRGG